MAPRLRPRRGPESDRVEADAVGTGAPEPSPSTDGEERLFGPAAQGGAGAPTNGHGGPAGDGSTEANGHGPGHPARELPERLPPRAGPSPRERTPIYDEVASAWFQEAPDEGGAPEEAEWSATSGDDGWRAAAASVDAVAETATTEAGLPKRRPRAQLVPGAARPGGGPPPASGPAGPRRNADAIRGRLASYQQGVADGRTTRRARPADTEGDPAPSARPGNEEDQ
jgi:hypothetical protein